MTKRSTTILSSEFQISVPEGVRIANNWKAGQELAFVPTPDGILLVAVPTIEELRGIAKGADPTGYRDRNDRY